MFVVIDDRASISDACVACFDREGIAAVAVDPADFDEWSELISDSDLSVVEGFLVGLVANRKHVASRIRSRCRAPLIGILETRALTETLELFSQGFDDVLAKPFHVREILARSGAIRRRGKTTEQSIDIAGIRIFFDGRDPIVNGDVLALPRRERRILECLVLNRNTRVTKTQIFNRVYGIFNDEIHENVIESHISRLRKRLKQRLGRDPIDSQRFLGYQLKVTDDATAHAAEEPANSLTQGPDVSLSLNPIRDEEKTNGPVRRHDHQHLRHVCPG